MEVEFFTFYYHNVAIIYLKKRSPEIFVIKAIAPLELSI